MAVSFGDGDLVGVGHRYLLEDGADHSARPAPLGPEVDEYGFVASDQLVERSVGSRDRVLSHIVGRRAALTSSVMS